jgi:predicted NAD/FAD-binding protein
MERQKIAIIGSGISGLSAAWLLSRHHQVTLYEAGSYLGGHANTVDVETPEGTIPVDTGFIVFNRQNYPNLSALFDRLDVPTHATEMEFAFSANNGGYEYSSTGANGFFGQRRNLLNPEHWRFLKDLARFFNTATTKIDDYPEAISLGTFLDCENYSASFVEGHILPMGAAIWSTAMAEMMDFPARSFIEFYANHGLLEFGERPVWQSVIGGSRAYIARLVADADIEVLLNNPVRRVVRHPGYVHISDARGTARPFDQVVIATHADQALALLDNPAPLETRLLSPFSYQKNIAVLHSDPRWMPKRKNIWSSWNYMKRGAGYDSELCVTYWMNCLQQLDTKTNMFVTLNPYDEIHPKAVAGTFEYDHPVYNAAAMEAQKHLGAIQGTNRTWFCGAHLGYGFHEDGAQSGLAVAEAIGGVQRPWNLENPSGRIAAYPFTSREAAE